MGAARISKPTMAQRVPAEPNELGGGSPTQSPAITRACPNTVSGARP